ncbi:MAG: nucleotide exchange factor GrpE [Tenericutes bacterium GWD2_38_27]|nr:MAG: nucleotide exchange factor GrpE [Tenericutes bacterium GWA2_38_26]OHE32267.1 MAG: nucleotide exchange factor GrpE [Tenericutes bacterium GWD2_38_27]HCB66010.1 nucleotide exchange factor GrpE [Acholeplasmataceae bacterium]
MEDNKEKEVVRNQVPNEDHEEHDEHRKERKSKYKEQIEKLEEEIKDLKDKYLRSIAEQENIKKRIHNERIQERKYASKNLVGDILSPLEQMNKIVSMKTDNELLKNFLIGFKMVNDQFYTVLEKEGLKEIDALNKPFDPNYHYALEKLSNKDLPNGINLEVIQKGYTYKDQLLRPAMVKINEWSDENGKE